MSFFFLCQRTCLCFLFICINDCNSVWQSVSNTNHFGDYAESCLRWPWFVPVLFPQNRRPILIKTKFERNLVGEHTNSTALIQWDKTSPKSLHLSVAQPTKPIKSNPACLPLSSNDLYPPFKQFSFALGAWTWKWRVAGQMHVSKNLICLCTEPPASLSLSVPIPTLCCSGSVEARSPRALGSKKIEGGLERNAQWIKRK